MASVSLRGIKKVYDKNVTAVESFDLEIKDKEFIVLVGPSGCGKSTTLRMIAGLEDISDGDLYIADKKVNDVPPKDRDIAMVFQSYALYPHMSVFDNMAFAMKMRRVPKDEIRKKVEEAARILDIEELLQRKPRALSGGQRQRVAIGRAIVRNPQVFLMDEPLSNLDAKLRNQMRAEIILLRKRIDTTFIYVTHDQTEAMTLGDRIVIMNKGRIQQIGTPQEVFNSPANVFVAGFIGVPQMNFLEGVVGVSDGSYFASVPGARLSLNEEAQAALRARGYVSGDRVTVGIRPEHIVLTSAAAEGGAAEETEASIKSTLQVSELLGSEIYLHVRTADKAGEGGEGKALVIRTPVTPSLEELTGLAGSNAAVSFTMPKDRIHIFDSESGVNLVRPYLAEHSVA